MLDEGGIMKNKLFNHYYLFSCIGILIVSCYPLSMGIRVISDMISNGTVMKENYPKYIIPYTPISVAVIIGVLLMPLLIKFLGRFAMVGGTLVSTVVFFVIELLFEQKVVVSTAETITKLEDWQMFMCYTPPKGWGENITTYKTQTAVDILMGEYNPAFKLHFYIISVVLIITILNCLYGFGQMIKNGENKRLKALILQSVCSVVFLGLCILACFTAFWRDGNIRVSPLSAFLMTVFFILLGVTVGVFVGSFLLGKRKLFSVVVPSIVSALMTFLMYVGEMILLNGHLYILGSGFLFDSLQGIVFAPIDLLVVLLSGCVTALIFDLFNGKREQNKNIKNISIIILSVVNIVICLTITFALFICDKDEDKFIDLMGAVDNPEGTYRIVQLMEKKTDNTESTYEVGTYLNGTDFSSIGQILKNKIELEWKIYSTMTEEEWLFSSKLWGNVGIQVDTWNECEETIGVAVENPLETMEWLNKTGCFGFEGKHIMVSANSTLSENAKVNDINVTSGYNIDNTRITLNATLCADSKFHQAVNVYTGYATYEEEYITTKSGISALIVTTNGTNNIGYYNGDYYDPTAYWVKDNVFYALRVFGDEKNKIQIQDNLYRILDNI